MNETFTIIYKNEHFNVDPSFLINSSQKFIELIYNKEKELQNYNLKIVYDKLSPDIICNFLKICQNQEVNIQNSEYKEICLLALMFKANNIFNKILKYIHKNIDINFSIPSTQIDEINQNQYLILESKENELEYDSKTETDSKNNNNSKKKVHSVCYNIKIDNHMMKCPRFYLMKENEIIFMAKQKKDDIYIGEGDEFHLSEKKLNKPVKIKRDCRGYNVVNTDDQQFLIKYLKYGQKTSVCLSFNHNGEENHWNPKHSKSKECIKNEYGHNPRKSKKNMILKNERNHPTFILRRMSKKTFEIECHPDVNPIIAFSIAISQILGPMGL